MGKPASLKLAGMNLWPRLGLGTLLPFRLTGGPGPGGRVCRSSRQPRVLGDSRVGIGLSEAPLGRPRGDERVLRGAPWPPHGGVGRRAACGHQRGARLEAGKAGRRTGRRDPGAANSSATS